MNPQFIYSHIMVPSIRNKYSSFVFIIFIAGKDYTYR